MSVASEKVLLSGLSCSHHFPGDAKWTPVDAGRAI